MSRKTIEMAQEYHRAMKNIEGAPCKEVIDGVPTSNSRYAWTDLRDSAKTRSRVVYSHLDGDAGKVMVLFCYKVET